MGNLQNVNRRKPPLIDQLPFDLPLNISCEQKPVFSIGNEQHQRIIVLGRKLWNIRGNRCQDLYSRAAEWERLSRREPPDARVVSSNWKRPGTSAHPNLARTEILG